jgi:putative FmdB family regulatory protein
MPIYEYRCEACGTFEEMQRMSDPPLAKCPKCKRKVRRLISSTSFQLKGTGWYVTDYAKSGSGDANGAKKDPGADAGKSEGTSETKTESKTESKSEAKPAPKSVTKAESKSSSSGSTTEKSSS